MAHAARIVALVRVWARIRHLRLASAVVTVVAHVLGIVLTVCVRAAEDLAPFPLGLAADL